MRKTGLLLQVPRLLPQVPTMHKTCALLSLPELLREVSSLPVWSIASQPNLRTKV